MKIRACSLGTVLLFGCGIVPSLGDSSGDAGGAASGNPTTQSAGDAGAKGIDCITETETGATICTGISLCPGLGVDHDVFPRCGFRLAGAILDIECACGDSLCPLGVAQTCEQAKQLLATQTEAMVCMQIAEGRCTSGSSATPAASGAPSTCDKVCAADCAGVPGCLQLCGC